jgi:hypothetical protein
MHLNRLDVAHLALFTLSHMSPWKERDPQKDGRVYFSWLQDICALIEARWEQFWLKQPSAQWKEEVANALAEGARQGRFVSGEQSLNQPGKCVVASIQTSIIFHVMQVNIVYVKRVNIFAKQCNVCRSSC